MARSRDAGLKKRCPCSKRKWATCPHPWWFGFHHGGQEYRFSLDKQARRDGLVQAERLTPDKAKQLRDHYRALIRDGRFRPAASAAPDVPPDTRVTFGYVADQYLAKHVQASGRRDAGRAIMALYVARLKASIIPAQRGAVVRLDDKPIAEITTADVEAIRDGWTRLTKAAHGGRIGADRALKRLRHLFNWAITRGYVDRTPFRRHGVAVVHFAKETGRCRRLEDGEEARLRAQAGAYLQALIIAALQTGCRLGELLALQWAHVRSHVLLLPPEITKTNEGRDVPITAPLRALLDMRRHGPDGLPHPPEAYVFGNEVGERVTSIRVEWERACAAAGIHDLHFHDLRREFASRLLEAPGVAPHEVSGWLGHANISTTSRYLKTTRVQLQHTAAKFDAARVAAAKAEKAARAKARRQQRAKAGKIRTSFAQSAAEPDRSAAAPGPASPAKSVN